MFLFVTRSRPHPRSSPPTQYSRLVHEEEEEDPQQQQQQQQQQPNLGDELLRIAAAAAKGSSAPSAAAAPAPPPAGAAGLDRSGDPPQLPVWMSEQMIASLTSVLLELPFSRRAETEADLIGESPFGWLGRLWCCFVCWVALLLRANCQPAANQPTTNRRPGLKLMALAGFKADKGPEAFRLLAQVRAAAIAVAVAWRSRQPVPCMHATHYNTHACPNPTGRRQRPQAPRWHGRGSDLEPGVHPPRQQPEVRGLPIRCRREDCFGRGVPACSTPRRCSWQRPDGVHLLAPHTRQTHARATRHTGPSCCRRSWPGWPPKTKRATRRGMRAWAPTSTTFRCEVLV
jgi:hypothetical protein